MDLCHYLDYIDYGCYCIAYGLYCDIYFDYYGENYGDNNVDYECDEDDYECYACEEFNWCGQCVGVEDYM